MSPQDQFAYIFTHSFSVQLAARVDYTDCEDNDVETDQDEEHP